MPDKYFTVEEANQLIPELEQIVFHLMENNRSAGSIGEKLEEIQRQMQSGKNVAATELMNLQTELEFMIQVINEGLESIFHMGAQPKDITIGLVDFPALMDGKEVLLCWKYGEKSITHYHGLTDGFAGRKPVPQSMA